jgi:acetylglutamate kinase
VKLLVKLGGALLDDAASRHRLASELTPIAREHALTVVHGGGKQMTRFLAERGVESKFVNGLRVTSPEVVDAVLKVFAGSVNHELVAAFVKAGSRAVGLTGIDAGLTETVQMNPELGAVGRLTGADAAILNVLTANAFLPVVACVGGNKQGEIFNVNADQMAVACAAAFAADQLIFLTDVPGVKGGDGAWLRDLSSTAARQLIADGVATGGMEAKLNSACEALRGGVGAVRIAAGAEPNAVARLLAGEQLGTRMFLA